MKKIDDLFINVCVEYILNTTNFQEALSKGASVAKACSTCAYNLFTYCHFEDREDRIVTRALEGNYESKKIILDRIHRSEGQTT